MLCKCRYLRLLQSFLAVMFQGKAPVPSSRQLLVGCQNT
ncbi:hypothetical protein P20495_1732 [Pseudoalteromonas sp. BSi20495]|nr:hypothetical protein P20495_1732 [Pseudoalteromonas sp. BSi20495]